MRFSRRRAGRSSGIAGSADSKNRQLLGRAVAAVLIVYLLVCLGIGWYWSREPDLGDLALRPVADAHLLRLALSQSQSEEDPDLAKAEPRFNFDHNSWAMPASESEYRDGLKALNRYITRLENGDAHFYARADNLAGWIGDVSTRLGSLSQRLSASVNRTPLDDGGPERNKTPWLEIDDVFYEARGSAWALVHLLRAVEKDYADTLEKKNALVSLRQIIRELEATQEPIWSPMILNGSGLGVLANHSLVMANYLSRANAALIDLRRLLEQG